MKPWKIGLVVLGVIAAFVFAAFVISCVVVFVLARSIRFKNLDLYSAPGLAGATGRKQSEK